MPKTFYTDRDIDDLARSGVKEIAMNDDTVLTDLARERAERLGIALRAAQTSGDAPAPVATLRPGAEQLIAQVKADVIAKLGSQVDAALIERIVRRVVAQLEVRN